MEANKPTIKSRLTSFHYQILPSNRLCLSHSTRCPNTLRAVGEFRADGQPGLLKAGFVASLQRGVGCLAWPFPPPPPAASLGWLPPNLSFKKAAKRTEQEQELDEKWQYIYIYSTVYYVKPERCFCYVCLTCIDVQRSNCILFNRNLVFCMFWQLHMAEKTNDQLVITCHCWLAILYISQSY